MWDVLLCDFYWLMHKAVLAKGLGEYSQAGNPNRDTQRVGGVRETLCSCQRRKTSARTLLVNHSLLEICRLIEISSFKILELSKNMHEPLAKQCCN